MLNSKITWNDKITEENKNVLFSIFSNIQNYFKNKIDNILDFPSISWNINYVEPLIVDNVIWVEKWILKIYSSDFFEDISHVELKQILLEQIEKYENEKNIKIDKIDISDFNNDEYMFLKESLYNIIWNNFPFLEVSRLTKWSKVLDITFLGIKKINDTISKEFVDLFINKLKRILHKNFLESNNLNNTIWRVIRDNYKHITFSMWREFNILNSLFWKINNKKELFNNIFEEIDIDDIKVSLKWSKIKDINEVKEILFEEFNLWIWSSFIDNEWDVDINIKMLAFYEAEISSRNIVELNDLWENINFNFNFKKIKELSIKASILENKIVELYTNKKFFFNGTHFDIIVNWKINNILLRYVRKWDSIWDVKLFNYVNDYINILTSWFDFIAPIIDNSQLNMIEWINKQLEIWIISTDLIKNTYKNTLSIDSLKIQSRWKKWLRVFIDIVDMWIMNLNDFRLLAKKVESWLIDENNLEELLESGKTATNRFQNLILEIKSIYPWSKIALWWDEIFIFFEWEIDFNRNKLISDISLKLRKQDLVWRISSSYDSDENIYNYLDVITSINKIFEKKVEKIISKNSNVKVKKIDESDNIKLLKDLRWFTSINIDIDDKLKTTISRELNSFLLDLNNIIDYNMLKAILVWKKDNYVFNFKKYNLKIEKKNNYELLITIK